MAAIDPNEIVGYILLFCLVFGMSATVDIGCMQAQLRNLKAILCGIFLQFIVLPILGFAVVNILDLSHAMGITLLVVTSSPGGSYSNWWCSLFNADLALSVCMTAISTVLSTIMLPLNLLIYAKLSYGDDVIGSLDWRALFISLVVVISAIALGLLASEKTNSHRFNILCNKLGNFAGIALVMFSIFMSGSGEEDSGLWSRGWEFYVGVASPCILGVIIANIVTTAIRLEKPERVTASIECCYQNVGIATSVALAMFEGDELAEAMGVPLFYGIVEAVVLGIYCIICWKAGWTKAPSDEPFWRVISTSYEVLYAERAEEEQLLMKEEVEVKLSDTPKKEEDDDAGLLNFCYIQQPVVDEAGEGEPIPSISSKRDLRGSIIINGTPQKRQVRRRKRKAPSMSVVKLPSATRIELEKADEEACAYNAPPQIVEKDLD